MDLLENHDKTAEANFLRREILTLEARVYGDISEITSEQVRALLQAIKDAHALLSQFLYTETN